MSMIVKLDPDINKYESTCFICAFEMKYLEEIVPMQTFVVGRKQRHRKCGCCVDENNFDLHLEANYANQWAHLTCLRKK